MSEIDKKAVGYRVNQLRKSLGLTQEAFSQPFNVSRSTISQIEKGETAPSVEILVKMIQVYNTSFEYIIMGIGDINSTGKDQIKTHTKNSNGDIAYLEEIIEALKASNKDKERIIKLYESNSNK